MENTELRTELARTVVIIAELVVTMLKIDSEVAELTKRVEELESYMANIKNETA